MWFLARTVEGHNLRCNEGGHSIEEEEEEEEDWNGLLQERLATVTLDCFKF